MPELLIELLSEEIPARMQAQAARDFERMAREGLPAAQGDRTEELKGPRTSAPEQALEGFLRKAGLTRDQLTERDGVFFAVIEKQGRPTTEVLAEAIPAILRAF